MLKIVCLGSDVRKTFPVIIIVYWTKIKNALSVQSLDKAHEELLVSVISMFDKYENLEQYDWQYLKV